MNKIKNIKYEIIINPEDDRFCGSCTYKDLSNQYSSNSYCWQRIYKCLLFNMTLCNSFEKAERCGDCKLMTERFEKMPEIDPC